MNHTPAGTPFIRTPSENFASIDDYPYEVKYLNIENLHMAYVDEGSKDAPVVLMVHGMPTWGYLYRHMIKTFLNDGYRCIAPDHIGFGRSDKVTVPDWYNIARHTSNLRHLIEDLNLQNITLVVQDWGGPIGLAQYVNMSDRFSRIVIMNTWLHHDQYEYTPGILSWIEQNSPGGLLRENIPSRFNWGTIMAMATQRVTPQDSLLAILQGQTPQLSPEAQAIQNAYDAPFASLGEDGAAGPRRFPLSIPVPNSNLDNATTQTHHFKKVNATILPVHFVWGINDTVFTEQWGRQWHSQIPHSTWHQVDAGHFLQDTHGVEIAKHIISHGR